MDNKNGIKFQLSLKSQDGTVLLNCYAETAEEFKAQITELQTIKAAIVPAPVPQPTQSGTSTTNGCGLCGSFNLTIKNGVKNGRKWEGVFCGNCGAADFGQGWQKKK